MGRRESDASPTKTERNGCPARIPESMRMVEPEFPASSGPDGARRPSRPTPAIFTTLSLRSILTPSDFRQLSVDWQSALEEKKWISLGPSAMAASMA